MEQQEHSLKFGRWELARSQRELLFDGRPVPISSRAFDILGLLLSKAGSIVTKEEILRQVWPGVSVGENTLQVHMSSLRKALGPDRTSIQTISGRGYQWIGPAPEQAAEHAVALASPQAVLVPRRNLPAALSELIGRDDVIAEVARLLSTHRIVTLSGTGGIGKTKVALAVARHVAAQFPDGVHLAELAPISDPTLVQSTVANVLGLRLASGFALTKAVSQSLDGKRILLVLDNCEHVIDQAAATAEILAQFDAELRVLATSREPLRIEGEHVYHIPPLDTPPPGALPTDEILSHSAAQLFITRAGILPGSISPRELAAVATITRRLDGLPLAIELAASRAGLLGLVELAGRLDDRFRLLTQGLRTALARHQTLQAALDWSFELLSEREREVIHRFAVFNGRFDMEAATAVVRRRGDHDTDIIDILANLTNKSLLSVENVGFRSAYQMMETTRAYAMQKLVASGQLGNVSRRHACYWKNLAEQLTEQLSDPSYSGTISVDFGEMDNIRAAVDWYLGAGNSPRRGVDLTVSLVYLLFDLSMMEECHTRCVRALAHVSKLGLTGSLQELHLLAAWTASGAYTDGRPASVLSAWRRVLTLAEKLGDYQCKMRALWGLWNTYTYSGQVRHAIGMAQQFHDVAAAQGDQTKSIMGLRLQGISEHFLGHHAEARSKLEEVIQRYDPALHRWRTLGSTVDQALVSKATLSRVLWLQGEQDRAEELGGSALADAMRQHNVLSTGYILVEACIPIAMIARTHPDARRYLSLLDQAAQSHGLSIWQALGRMYVCLLAAKQERGAQTLSNLRSSIEELRQTGFTVHLNSCLGVMAELEAISGDLDAGRRTIDEAMERTRLDGDRWALPELLRIDGLIRLKAGGPGALGEVSDIFKASIELAREQGALFWELRAATTAAFVLRNTRHAGHAFASLRAVHARYPVGKRQPNSSRAAKLLRRYHADRSASELSA